MVAREATAGVTHHQVGEVHAAVAALALLVTQHELLALVERGEPVVPALLAFMHLGQRHEPVGWFMTDAPFYDIGDKEGLETFRAYWASKGEKGA